MATDAGVSKKLLTPSVTDAVIKKVNQKRITNSKDLRKLRPILRDPVARAHFLSDEGDIDSAMLRMMPVQEAGPAGLIADLEAAIDTWKRVPWTTMAEAKGNADVLKRIDDAEALLKSLRKTLSS
jgi:ParB family chromosome partitioning protein